MGYDLHLVRAHAPITPDEWRTLCAADPELVFDDDDSGGSHHFVADDGSEERLRFRAGRIDVTQPLPSSRGKLVRLADALGARVIGDDGEAYDAHGVIRPTVADAPVEIIALARRLSDPLQGDAPADAARSLQALEPAQIRIALAQIFLDVADQMPAYFEEDRPVLVQVIADHWEIAHDAADGSPAARELLAAAGRRRAAPKTR